MPENEVKLVPVDSVEVPSFLPTRKSVSSERLMEIQESIRKHGLQYPIKVRPGKFRGKYELIDGYLRLQCVKNLGWKEIPAEVKPATDDEVVIESVITNKHRIEEDPITAAKKLSMLVNMFGYTQERLAEELGVSQPWVADTIRLLKLPEEIQHYLALDNVSRYHALLLLEVDDSELQVKLAREVVEKHWSVRQLEGAIRGIKEAPEDIKPKIVELAVKKDRETPKYVQTLKDVPPEIRHKVVEAVTKEDLSPLETESLVETLKAPQTSHVEALKTLQAETRKKVGEEKAKREAFYLKLTRTYPASLVDEALKRIGEASEEKTLKFLSALLDVIWDLLVEHGLVDRAFEEASRRL